MYSEYRAPPSNPFGNFSFTITQVHLPMSKGKGLHSKDLKNTKSPHITTSYNTNTHTHTQKKKKKEKKTKTDLFGSVDQEEAGAASKSEKSQTWEEELKGIEDGGNWVEGTELPLQKLNTL